MNTNKHTQQITVPRICSEAKRTPRRVMSRVESNNAVMCLKRRLTAIGENLKGNPDEEEV